MAFRNTIGWFLAGFAAATLAVAAGGAGRAHAQSSFEPITQRADGLLTRPRVQTEASREELRSTLMPERVFDVPDGSNADGGTGTPLGGSRPPVRRAGDGREAPIQQREARPVREDGSFQPEPVARNGDGVFSEPEPAAPKDGEDPTRQDTRSPRDADAFATPQALTDRTLASLAVEPLYDRLTDRLFRFEPYERVGYSFGSFVLFPEVELGALWRSNVLRAPDARQDAALTAVPAIEAISNWNRHAMALRAAGNFSAYRDFESENDRSQQLEARGRIDVTRRTNIEALASRSVAQELRSSIDAAQGGTRSDITTDRLIGAYNTRFNRLSLQLRGGVEEVSFGAATDQGGLPVSNRDRDSSRRLIAARATWEFKPTLFAFAEAGGDERTFDAASRNDGILRDSSGRYVKTGVGFGNSGAFLRGEIGIGYRRQDLADRRLEDVDGLLLDADLAWRINAFSSLRLRSLTEFVDTTLADSGGALARRIELAYRHELRRHLIATGGLAYSWQTFSGRELSEHTISALLGLDYYVSRDVALFARYQHTDFDSGDGARDYVDDTFGIGVRIRR